MKNVTIRILSNTEVCRDTTVGKEYPATFYKKGEPIYTPVYTSDSCRADTCIFTDDVGDMVEAWVSGGRYEIIG